MAYSNLDHDALAIRVAEWFSIKKEACRLPPLILGLKVDDFILSIDNLDGLKATMVLHTVNFTREVEKMRDLVESKLESISLGSPLFQIIDAGRDTTIGVADSF
jgi:hypothetical protein